MSEGSVGDAILLSAFVIHPSMTSEPGVGWQFALATGRVAAQRGLRVLVVTNRRSYDSSVDAIPDELRATIELVCVDLPVDPPFFRWHYPRFTRLEHEWWVRHARRTVRRLAATNRIVYAHHVTFATELLGTPITALDDTTLRVWGPVGAGGVASVFLLRPRHVGGLVQAAAQAARTVVIRLVARRVTRRCDLVLAQNESAARALGGSRVPHRIFSNVVVEETRFGVDRSPRAADDGGLKLLYVGHVIPRKRPDIAVEILSSPHLQTATLEILGHADTPCADTLRRRIHELGLGERVRFHGNVSRDEVGAAMASADVLVHPSGREGASGVVGEATSVGLPVMCFAGTGAASVLRQCGGAGVVVDPRPTMSIDDMAVAVIAAARDTARPDVDWSTRRFERLARELIELADRRRGEP
ncbi:glycosyltransferase [Williamsia sp.]|uniref:glycosyltransferase n=1 Tax=Williamsia sp. TaxID=1872085 RepID=UPI001A201108|nr:glycosyltransferase [Williamsia sp.]MBJ7289751.1 glycosyltransferase [Williamsia sp.]